ncbi:trypsin-like peptidase domain-containing protein [Chryseobacterium sp. OSA05B]|uniref:trypsin-like peptidase domain-containing protein n=1 Tax=Chryseobacterium sp. OSA05B TaxID=2862650 RepID=UPI001CC0CBF6|nr:trypsin-like peptidase domain-containing protein [Chryseobacterium sp. OSA05B]
MRNIPENNLAYPVLILIDNNSTGSGFLYTDTVKTYLVTAKHVIYDSNTRMIIGKSAIITCQDSDPLSDQIFQYKLDFKELASNHKITISPNSDIGIIEVFDVENQEGSLSFKNTCIKGVQKVRQSNNGSLISVDPKAVGSYEEVLISNDVFLYGYPISLGLQGRPQFNFHKPLLRKGIVAGLNSPTKTIVLDCPSYYGNSGGPVVQVEAHLDGTHTHKIIGVMSEFIPFQEQWINNRTKSVNTQISNSGYSIAVSMDKVNETIELHRTIQSKK